MGVWIAAAVIGILALHLFLIAPNPKGRRRCRALPGKLYAHRGLHDGNQAIPENSMAAFRLAVEMGYGIELDVRLTKDGQAVVHHDAALRRLCGMEKQVADVTADDLASCRLARTAEGIPLFPDVLNMVNGRVPLIIEIKNERIGRTLTAKTVWACLKDYAGPCCIESFDPMTLRWFKKNAPQVIRGQLAYDPWRSAEKKRVSIGYKLPAHLMTNWLSRPDFIAYDLHGEQNPSFRLARRLFHPCTAAWTIRTKEELARCQETHDLLIFEAIRPET